VPLGQNNAPREANKQAAAGGRRNSPNYTTRAPSINLLELSRRIIAPVDLLSLDSRDSLQIICTKSGKIVGVLAARSVSALAREERRAWINSINKEQLYSGTGRVPLVLDLKILTCKPAS
jgi:hypothetical protein